MAPKAERVSNSEEYQLRTNGCSCCGKYLVPQAGYDNCKKQNKSYLSKYAGPVIFAAAIIGAAIVGSCQHDFPSRNSLHDTDISSKLR